MAKGKRMDRWIAWTQSAALAGLVVILLALTTPTVKAEAVAVANAPGTVVTVFNEPCALKAVINLPLRATWTQNGKTIEGCFGSFGEAAALGMFFADGTVVVIPMAAFQRVTEL